MDEGEERSDIGVIGFASHNARIVQIRRMCMTPPTPDAVILRLAVTNSGEVLAAFPRDECARDKGRAIPEAISLALEEHAETTAAEVNAILGWCRHDGSTITTKRLRARPRTTSQVVQIPGMTLEETAQIVGDGDARALVGHVIRSNEIYLRSYLQGHHTTLQEQREVNHTSMEQAKMSGAMAMEMFAKTIELMQQIGKFQAEAIALRAENETLQRQLAAFTGEEVAADQTASDEARAELIRNVTDGVTKAAPEAWSIFKVWAINQAREHAKAAAAGQVNGSASNGANGHAGGAE
jgi:regulator of replication initiation timing